jgi:hypothetical protein
VSPAMPEPTTTTSVVSAHPGSGASNRTGSGGSVGSSTRKAYPHADLEAVAPRFGP